MPPKKSKPAKRKTAVRIGGINRYVEKTSRTSLDTAHVEQLMFVEQNKHLMPKDEAVIEHYNQMFNKAYKAPPPAASD